MFYLAIVLQAIANMPVIKHESENFLLTSSTSRILSSSISFDSDP